MSGTRAVAQSLRIRQCPSLFMVLKANRAHACYRSRHEILTPSGIIRAVYIAAVRDTVVTRDS
jgi:hypothetical protein